MLIVQKQAKLPDVIPRGSKRHRWGNCRAMPEDWAAHRRSKLLINQHPTIRHSQKVIMSDITMHIPKVMQDLQL